MTDYTPSQQQAIHDHGHDVLVSASAGSGKTTVLVERILAELRAGAELSQLLIVTFTTAATAEMKLKIQKKLKAAVAETPLADPIRQHLVKQVAIANAAPIMTLDAFCLQVVQQYYYAIALDPGFRLLSDEVERTMLAESVWGDLRETLYASDEAKAFIALTDNFAHGQDDQGLQETVFALTGFANTTTDPTRWLAQLAAPYAPAAFGKYFATQLWPDLQTSLADIAAQLDRLAQSLDPNDKGLAAVQAALMTTQQQIGAAAKLQTPDYADAYAAIHAVAWPTWPRTKVADDEAKAVKADAKAQRDAQKARFNDAVGELMQILPADLTRALTHAYPLMQTLGQVCQEFLLAFAAEKQRRQLQDFSDIAHNALKILHTLDPQTGKPIAENFQASFTELMIDEYQDINPLQEALLDAISRPGAGNRFMVGDVKQSIYGFRLADPRLFLAKYQRFGAKDSPGERIVLAENFRSSRNVLDFTNFVFSQLMDQAVGEMAYDHDAELKRATFQAPADWAPTTEFLLAVQPTVDPDADELSQAAMDKATAQAELVIAKIKTLINDPQAIIYDGQDADGHWQSHHIGYGDITLLVRSRSQNITIQSAFAKANIPIVVADAQNYFKTTELMTMMSLLRLIDNPRQEIALAAVLRSPLVGMSADALALIRLAAPQASFDDAWLAFLAQPSATPLGQATYAKAQVFNTQLATLRAFAREHELVALIWKIYDMFGYLDFVGGLPGGAQRQANLRALATRAAAYENGGFKGLFAFIHFIELMQKQAKDLAMPVSLQPDADAVSLRTIHGSKGLEFPVVFLMAADKQFNLQDLKARQILTPELAGIQWVDPQTQERYALPQYQLAKLSKKKQLLAEEMRLLYVALTRAQQRLFIVASVKDETSFTEDSPAAAAVHQVLPANLRAAAHSYLDWFKLALARHPQVGGQSAIQTYGAKVAFTTTVEAPVSPVALAPAQAVQPPLDLDLSAWLDWDYPYQAETQTTGFQSVTEIKRARSEDPDNTELVRSNRQLLGNRYVSDFAKPQFLATTKTVAATAVGTATHLLLQRLDLHQDPQISVPATLKALVAAGQIDDAVAKRIDQAAVLRFFTEPLGQLLLAQADAVQREVAFSLLLPATQVFTQLAKDQRVTHADDVLVHGIIDGFVTTDEGVILFDYKTDHVTDVQALVTKYEIQLQLYAQALAHLQAKPVLRRELILLETGQVKTIAKGPQE
ncbi:helicase-exonuclease AddAB subunit AddA [Lacticaseibacillus baoqingensis]|uniref:ATP-dependent helicase/nuclease subunit A n=1 Tax=Lacticaseibacillus baoqingensis TaxID=2486013 RepID=A0ABW4E970_9LACO|nr:helicase-exonuclease AddAB subunit AddA [Lacticaseibacillus baoqingensis]